MDQKENKTTHLKTKTSCQEVDETMKELNPHGSVELPIEAYQNNCEIFRAIYTHWHKEMEIIYIEKGLGVCRLDKDSFRIKKGDMILISSETLHYIQSDRQSILYFKSIVFDLSLLAGIPGDLCQETFIDRLINNEARFIHMIHQENAGYEKIQLLFCHIFNCYKRKAPYFYVELKGLLYQLFYQLLYHNYIIPSTPCENKNLSAIKKVIRYMNEHYKEPLHAQQLAAISHYNESYFMKIFKQYTGKTLISYINELRIDKSRHLLLHTNLSITDIAFETGFSNASYFIKKFQELNGITPQKLRKTQQHIS